MRSTQFSVATLALCVGMSVAKAGSADNDTRRAFMSAFGFQIGRTIDPRDQRLAATSFADEFSAPVDRAANGFDEVRLRLSRTSHTLSLITATAKYASASECQAEAKKLSNGFADQYGAKVRFVKEYDLWTARLSNAEREISCNGAALEMIVRDPEVIKILDAEAIQWRQALSCDREPVADSGPQFDEGFAPVVKVTPRDVAPSLRQIASRVEGSYNIALRSPATCVDEAYVNVAAMIDHSGSVRAVQLLGTNLRISKLVDSAQEEVWRQHFAPSPDAGYRLVKFKMQLSAQ